MLSNVVQYVKRASLQACDQLLFPPHCLGCDQPASYYGNLCVTCFKQLHVISTPYCKQCGEPFEYALPYERCDQCETNTPTYDKAVSLWKYDTISAHIVKRLKFHDRNHYAAALAPMLYASAMPLLQECDVILPVPLHYRRARYRRYNQAMELAKQLGVLSDIPVRADILQRVRQTQTQTSLTLQQRKDNVTDAFALHPLKALAVQGKTVALIDDVMTTGATLQACAQTLKKAGVAQVSVITLCKRVKEAPLYGE